MSDEVLTAKMYFLQETLNMRPVAAASDDPEDLEVFTANRFFAVCANICVFFYYERRDSC